MNRIGVGEIVLGKEEKNLLKKAVEANRLSYGPLTKKFERLFAEEHDSEYAVFCSSGTAALWMAVAALKEKYQWKEYDEIIVPATTFIATSNVVIHNNLTPVFVDVDSKTYNIDPALIEDKITKRTRAIIPVHLFGQPADMDSILDIAEKYDLKIIEDSCQCMFAKYKGKKVGSFGEVGCFSTYIAHFLVTGIGGFCISSDPEITTILRSLMNHGRDPMYISIDDDKNVSMEQSKKIIEKRFSFIHIGFNFRVTELESALGLAQFKRRRAMIARRKVIAKRFIERLVELPIQLPTTLEDRDHNFMLFPIVLKQGNKKNLVQFLEKNNIETRDMFPLITQPAYKKMFNLDIADFPVSKWIYESGFYIGCHQYITDSEVEYVIKKLYEFFKKRL